MEVKIFTKSIKTKELFWPGNVSTSDVGLEGEINQWLATNPEIKITNITQSQSGGSWRPSTVTVCIWYTK